MGTISSTQPICAIQDRIEAAIGQQKFKVWFKNTTHFSIVDEHLRIGVPNQFMGTWIENHFSEAIRTAAREVLGREARLYFVTDPKLFGQQGQRQLDTQAKVVQVQLTRTKASISPGPLPVPSAPMPYGSTALRFALSDFVVGQNSQLAYAAIQDVIHGRSASYSPLFVHSNCGLGKTHLLQGLCQVLRQGGQTSFCYVTGEQFTNEFIAAIRTHQAKAFRDWYRRRDVLVIDDVHFLANKRATQEELQHTFDTLAQMGKTVVLASDTHPTMLGQLSASLMSRFASGMVVKIDAPDVQTRRAILRRKAGQFSQPVPEAVIQYVADLFSSNVRELEGALLKLCAFARLVQQPLTVNLARHALEEYARKVGPAVKVSDIEAATSSYFGVTTADLHSTNKTRTVALARNVAMYIVRKHTKLSFPEIARHMGGKNHATVLLACRKIEKMSAAGATIRWLSGAGPVERGVVDVLVTICRALNLPIATSEDTGTAMAG